MAQSKMARGASVLAVVLLALTGCTTGQGTSSQTSSSSTAETRSSASPTSSAPVGSISLETVRTFTLRNRRSLGLALTGNAAFVSASPPGGDRPSQVLRLDLSSGKQSLVASSHWSSGEIDSVAASGNWIVWVDQSDLLSTGGPGGSTTVLWRVWAKNLTSGRRILLDTNGSTPDPLPPALVAGDGYVGWTILTGRTVRSPIWKPGWAHSRTLSLPVKAYGPSAIADGKVIFLRYAKTKLGRRYGLGDCWSYPLRGKGSLQQLTHSGLVQRCHASGTDLVWTEHIDPATHDSLTVRDAADDAYELKTVSLEGATEPRTIHEGSMQADPVVGSGFTLWFPSGPAQVSALDSSASTSFKGGGLAWWAATHGNLVAYPREGKRSTTVSVVRVTMSGP
jgi:hypothetical protein